MSDEPTERDVEALARVLPCSQCGQTLADRACGPTHALLAAQPWRHRLLGFALAQARLEGAVEALEAFGNRVATPKGAQDGPTLYEVWHDALDTAAALRGDA